MKTNNNFIQAQYPIVLNSHSELKDLVIQLLAFSGAQLGSLTLGNSYLDSDTLDEELLIMLEDGTIDNGFYIYWEQDSDSLLTFTREQWEQNQSEDESEYTYHTVYAKYDNNLMAITLAIN